MKIAYRELLSVVIALLCFASDYSSTFVRINSDNQNVVSWLNSGRSSKKLGYRFLSVIELMKIKYNLKVVAYYIESSKNTSADTLFKGRDSGLAKKTGD